jgi:hypothetical protein
MVSDFDTGIYVYNAYGTQIIGCRVMFNNTGILLDGGINCDLLENDWTGYNNKWQIVNHAVSTILLNISGTTSWPGSSTSPPFLYSDGNNLTMIGSDIEYSSPPTNGLIWIAYGKAHLQNLAFDADYGAPSVCAGCYPLVVTGQAQVATFDIDRNIQNTNGSVALFIPGSGATLAEWNPGNAYQIDTGTSIAGLTTQTVATPIMSGINQMVSLGGATFGGSVGFWNGQAGANNTNIIWGAGGSNRVLVIFGNTTNHIYIPNSGSLVVNSGSL